MSSKRFRRKRSHKRPSSMVNMLRAIKESASAKVKVREIRHTYQLTETDRISYVYQASEDDTVVEVTCVSYELLVADKWYTAVYYDNCHGGILHRHVQLSIEKNLDMPNIYGVKQKGTSKELLTWANNDLRRRYPNYRTGFFRKNRQYIKDHRIDI